MSTGGSCGQHRGAPAALVPSLARSRRTGLLGEAPKGRPGSPLLSSAHRKATDACGCINPSLSKEELKFPLGRMSRGPAVVGGLCSQEGEWGTGVAHVGVQSTSDNFSSLSFRRNQREEDLPAQLSSSFPAVTSPWFGIQIASFSSPPCRSLFLF